MGNRKHSLESAEIDKIYVLPHPNHFKFHVPTSSLAHACLVYLLPLSGTHWLTAFVSVNL